MAKKPEAPKEGPTVIGRAAPSILHLSITQAFRLQHRIKFASHMPLLMLIMSPPLPPKGKRQVMLQKVWS